MNDFVTATQLASFGAAVAAVVAFVNTAMLLGGERLREYAKWVAVIAAILVTIAARGVPQSVAAGLTVAVNAVYVFLAALGGNGAVVDGLTWRQANPPAVVGPATRGVYGFGLVEEMPRPARFWRKW